MTRLTSVGMLILLVCAAAENGGYLVKFDRRIHKGDQLTLENVYAEVRTKTIHWQGQNTPELLERSTGSRLLADAMVLETDAQDHILEMSFTVQVCTEFNNGKDVEMIAPGKVIVAKADEQKPKFTIDGASAPADIAELLARLIPLYPSNKTISYDAIFGLPTPVKIGQSWPVHADAMAEHWKHLGYLFKAEDVSGQVKADSLEQYNNEPCIKFEADYYISQFVKEPTTLPTQYKVDSSSRRGHLEWMMPVSTKPIQEFSSVNTITDNTDGKFKGRRYSMTEVTKLAYDSRIVPQQMPTTKEE